jgi:uncharacterized membrane protein
MDYDQTPIRSFTEYSYEQSKKFQRYHAKGYRLAFANIIWLIILIIGGVLIFFHDVIRDIPALGWSFAPVIITIILTIIVFIVHLMGGFYTKARHQKAIAGVGQGQVMLFRNSDCAVAYDAQEPDVFTSYDEIYCVRETDDAFYLYLTKRQALIISKSGITNASPIALRSLLERNLPDKCRRDLKVKITKR